jgi:phage-related minor tail protein
MSDNDKLDRLIANLRQQRDELRVQMHLAKADAQDEWQKLEKKWQQIEVKLERAGAEARESAGDVGTAVELVAKEIGRAYDRIRKALD